MGFDDGGKNWCGGMGLLGGIIFGSVAEPLEASADADMRHLGEHGSFRDRRRYVTRLTGNTFASKVLWPFLAARACQRRNCTRRSDEHVTASRRSVEQGNAADSSVFFEQQENRHHDANVTATEVTANRRWSPIGTPQRHYRLDQHVTADDGERYHDVVIIDGFGITYAYAAYPDGEVASWWTLAELDGSDTAVLSAIGFRIGERAQISA